MINEEKMEIEMASMGYGRVYDYTQYSHDNHVNVIPEQSFRRLVHDTFNVITETLRETYGPYGSTVMISDQNQTITTKDGYNVFESIGFNQVYKQKVYLAIQQIIERVNRNVGDGTTSCILLAEKIFNNVNQLMTTPEVKRQILKELSEIESDLQDSSILELHKETKIIMTDITKTALMNLIRLASNYDDELVNVLYEAFSPEYDNEGFIVSVRNVVAEREITMDSNSNVQYKIDYLPGDYRVRVNMDVEFGLALSQPTKIKTIIYDHAFSSSDWINFMKSYDGENVLILARTFTKSFMDNEYVRFLKEYMLKKLPVPLYLAEIKGEFVQNEIHDLAALLGIKARDMNDLVVNFDELPITTVQVYKGNCMCFYDVTSPTGYVDKLRKEMNKDLSGSYITRKEYLSRIKALSLTNKDTLVTAKCGTSLESKMIMDKIDDCTAIVNSAIENGIVPNMLVYAYFRMECIRTADDSSELMKSIVTEIQHAITGLFSDLWDSKYGKDCKDGMDDEIERIYDFNTYFKSYDLIHNELTNVEDLPTSSEYDLEVVVAALSIVKYLLTSRAFIFDAHLLPPIGDVGHYEHY